MAEAARSAEAALDLVCGPRSALPETRQRYRLVNHIATGGQAEVYRGVRLSAGVASSPVTVKVFRASDERPIPDQLRSWDKGDAVLADLGVRNVPWICRRVEAFNGPLPYAPGTDPDGDEVPYQILEYLPGWSLRDIAGGRHPKVDGAVVLRGLADALLGLHKPPPRASTPVLHMDVTPGNVIVLPDGSPRLIDFTGARYDRRDHITSIAFTAQAGGPEALQGQVSPAYDVHGFGAVAYFLVTGQLPREVGESAPPTDQMTVPRARWSVLRPAAELAASPRLAEHLFAPLADEPTDRPRTDELPAWVDRLVELAAAAPDTCEGGVANWPGTSGNHRPVRGSAKVGAAESTPAKKNDHDPKGGFTPGRAVVGSAAAGAAVGAAVAGGAAGAAVAGVSASRPDATQVRRPGNPFTQHALDETRIDQPGAEPARVAKLEQEVVELRALLRDGRTPVPRTTVAPDPTATRIEPPPRPVSPAAVKPPSAKAPVDKFRGAASVRPPAPPPPTPEPAPAPRQQPYAPPPPVRSGPKRGRMWSVLGGIFLLVCWGLWAAANLLQKTQDSGTPSMLGIGFVLASAAAIAPFWLCRLAGRMILADRQRASALPSHLCAAAFSVLVGLTFMSLAPPPDFAGFFGLGSWGFGSMFGLVLVRPCPVSPARDLPDSA